MRQDAEIEKQIVRYLLGDLSDVEKASLDDRLMLDEEWFDRFLAMETELIDQYVRDELSPTEREKFEKIFLSVPHRRRQLESAKVVLKVLNEKSAAGAPTVHAPGAWRARRPAIGWSLAAAAVLVVVAGGSWLMVKNQKLTTQVERLQTEQQSQQRQEQERQQKFEQQRARSDELAEQLRRGQDRLVQLEQRGKTPSPQPLILSFALSPTINLRRDPSSDRGAIPKLSILPDAHQIELQLELADDEAYQSYRVELRSVEKVVIWSRNWRSTRVAEPGPAVVLRLPSRLFRRGYYILTLNGARADRRLEPVGDYHFEVVSP
ncbi:MAG: hypothetical protein HYR55_05000 [Acidobacteria bacterium]|nr:hypothetical protein [Acidobacteriota bacterium]